MDNHNWILSNKKLTEQDELDCVIAKHICTICKCERITQLFPGESELGINDELSYLYNRNGQHYDHYIECIDWNIENNKQID